MNCAEVRENRRRTYSPLSQKLAIIGTGSQSTTPILLQLQDLEPSDYFHSEEENRYASAGYFQYTILSMNNSSLWIR